MRNTPFYKHPVVVRLVSCLALGLMLALMVGDQEGTREDYGLAFREALFGPRIVVFLGIGALVFIAITYWPKIVPYLTRPGVRPLAVGALSVVVGYVLLRWSDSDAIKDGKLGTLAPLAAGTDGLAPFARTFFGSGLYWILFVVVFALAGGAIILRRRWLAWAAAVAATAVGLWAYVAHAAVQAFLGTPDHSTGASVSMLAYLTIAAAAAAVALTPSLTADTRGFQARVMGWRPGFPLAALGLVVGLLAFAQSTWFAPLSRNATLVDSASLFAGSGLSPLGTAYLAWLGYVLFALAAVLALAATYLRNPILGWSAAGLGLVSVVLTLMTMYAMSSLAAAAGVDFATGPWQNLGAGPWLACLAFCFLAGGGYTVVSLRFRRATERVVSSDGPGLAGRRVPGAQLALFVVVLAAALFVPPTMTEFWQKVLVSEIGVYVLLAIGLNVVVGWAGLLDLGYIAFYAIGSYTTAYLVGSLPIKPPSWLLMSPLWAIPFAIVICLIAGLALGAPTLRLRGDYLAIVTLGFGEIIRIAAINNPGNITNSTRGPTPAVPHPVISIGPIHIEWGLNNLQYWYLLLVLILIVVVLFNRLEGSRLGRAWAAIREDEVAAQATGINTTRVKLLAFAIGASTSGVAGVFFASQVGYFNPDNFVLNNSILVVAYVVFGGMGSLPGAMAGAAVLTWMPEFLRDQVPAEDRQMWIGVVILLMMIFRPQGLIPARRRTAELHGLDGVSSSEIRAVPADEGMSGTPMSSR
ncbi:MAG: branched-chain amino acid ABC transporter permease [Actinomycetota bacterium]|nr:branched-chain amino acid ABC transporter permease [Actinomycetota bacterium]